MERVKDFAIPIWCLLLVTAWSVVKLEPLVPQECSDHERSGARSPTLSKPEIEVAAECRAAQNGVRKRAFGNMSFERAPLPAVPHGDKTGRGFSR